MSSGWKYLWIGVLCCAFTSLDLDAQEDSLVQKGKYAPDHLRMQFAGNIGMVSVGPNWLILNEKVEVGFALGYVSRQASVESIYPVTIKAMYSPPWQLKHKGITWQALSAGAAISRSYGIGLSIYRDNDIFPDSYYWWGAGTRLGLILDTELETDLKKGPFSKMGLYLEASFWDVYLYSAYANGNFEYLDFFEDVLILGTGVKLYF